MTHIPLRILAAMFTLIAILHLDPTHAAQAPVATSVTRHAAASVHLIVTGGLVVFEANAG